LVQQQQIPERGQKLRSPSLPPSSIPVLIQNHIEIMDFQCALQSQIGLKATLSQPFRAQHATNLPYRGGRGNRFGLRDGNWIAEAMN
jgi:hypothetical protein